MLALCYSLQFVNQLDIGIVIWYYLQQGIYRIYYRQLFRS